MKNSLPYSIGQEWYELTADKLFKSFALGEDSFQIWKRKLYTLPFLEVKQKMLSWEEDPQLLIRIQTGSPDVNLLKISGLSPVIQSRSSGNTSALFTQVLLKPQHWATEDSLNGIYNIVFTYWYEHTSSFKQKEANDLLKGHNMTGYLNFNSIKYCEGLTLECLMFD